MFFSSLNWTRLLFALQGNLKLIGHKSGNWGATAHGKLTQANPDGLIDSDFKVWKIVHSGTDTCQRENVQLKCFEVEGT